jgi:hypothetical protein
MLDQPEKSNGEYQLTFIIGTTFTGILAVFIWCIGVFLHSKIIAVSIKEKEMTWKFDVFNSFLVVFHYGHIILMKGLTFFVQDLYTFTGRWFCYTSKAINMYTNTHVLHQTSMICAMKYIIIVKDQWARQFGHEHLKTVFLCINILYPFFVVGIFTLVDSTFFMRYDALSHANRCLGKSDLISSIDSNRTASKMHDFCRITEPLDNYSFEYVIYICKTTICWINVTFFYSNMWNITEAFMYWRIFSFMRR